MAASVRAGVSTMLPFAESAIEKDSRNAKTAALCICP